jgi:hypothetical protein
VLTLSLGLSVAQGQIPQGDIVIDLDLVSDGLVSPVYATHAGDHSGRLFVVDQVGLIRIIDADGTLLPSPFLDLTTAIVTLCTRPAKLNAAACGARFQVFNDLS